MSVPLEYKDTVTLVTTTVNDYGDDIVVDEQEDVAALVLQNTGTLHADNQQAVISDLQIYIDIENSFVSDNFYRLEEMYVINEFLGTPEDRGWYEVIGVTVGQDKLLDNEVDNVLLDLKKTSNIYHVS